MKVVIFCGGLGLRMGEASSRIPKPMIPVGERPILWHIMQYYAAFGHTDFVLCTGYKADVIEKYFSTYTGSAANGSERPAWSIAFADTSLESVIGQRLKAVESTSATTRCSSPRTETVSPTRRCRCSSTAWPRATRWRSSSRRPQRPSSTSSRWARTTSSPRSRTSRRPACGRTQGTSSSDARSSTTSAKGRTWWRSRSSG